MSHLLCLCAGVVLGLALFNPGDLGERIDSLQSGLQNIEAGGEVLLERVEDALQR